jgi:hypothetical protein
LKPLGVLSQFEVTSSILWGDSPDAIAVGGSGGLPTVSESDVDQDGYAGSNGNIRQDPGLEGNYHLTAGSPCIDAADNAAPLIAATDIDGDARKLDGDDNGSAIADMGADELVPPPPGGWTTASTIPGHRTSRQEFGTPRTVNVLAMLLLPLGTLALYRTRNGQFPDSRDLKGIFMTSLL